MKRVFDSLLFALVYLLLLGGWTAADWLIAGMLGVALAPLSSLEPGVRLRALPKFAAGSLHLVLRGCLLVLRTLLGGRHDRHAGYVELPVAPADRLNAATVAFVATTAPGTAVAEIDVTKRRLIVNTIDARDASAVRAELERFQRRFVNDLFE